jgi:hypothetical protein
MCIICYVDTYYILFASIWLRRKILRVFVLVYIYHLSFSFPFLPSCLFLSNQYSDIEISRKVEDHIHKLFLDPTGTHLVISMENEENYCIRKALLPNIDLLFLRIGKHSERRDTSSYWFISSHHFSIFPPLLPLAHQKKKKKKKKSNMDHDNYPIYTLAGKNRGPFPGLRASSSTVSRGIPTQRTPTHPSSQFS